MSLDAARVDPDLTGPDGPASSSSPTSGRARLVSAPPAWPALDGLRALAVAAVLLFHGGFSWARGGFLGVSTFFTLSGFLITTLLMAEHERSGAIDRVGFLRRRVRRLVPAALAGVALAVLFGLTVASADQQRALFGDTVAALTYTLNWRFIIGGRPYALIFAAPSPLQHFWSLAIEGQFYLVFPLVAAALLGRRHHTGGPHPDSAGRPHQGPVGRARLGGAVGAAMAASLALTLFAGYSQERIYYGTDTRVFELLAGAALALLLAWRRERTYQPAHGSTSPASPAGVGGGFVMMAGLVALGACVWLWSTTDLSASWLYHGGLPLYSGLSALVVAGLVLAPAGWFARALSWAPLRSVGLISYGLYLFHWPIFLWLTPARTGLALWPDFGLRLLVTTLLALASYFWLEVPVRQQRWPAGLVGPSRVVVAVAVTAVVLLGALAVTARATAPANDFTAAQRALAHPGGAGGSGPTVGWFGDSTGLVLAEGAVYSAGKPLPIVNDGGEAHLGCGIGPGGRRRLPDGEVFDSDPVCDAQLDSYRQFVEQKHPDLAVVLYGPNDLYDRQVPGVCATWCQIGQPAYDRWLDAQMLRIVDVLSRRGAQVVWLTSPPMPDLGPQTQRLNQMIERLPSQRPGRVRVVDLAGHLTASGHDAADRPDGIHLSDTAAVVVGQGWLDPTLARIGAAGH